MTAGGCFRDEGGLMGLPYAACKEIFGSRFAGTQSTLLTALVDNDQSSNNFVIHVYTEVASTSKILEEVANVHGEQLRCLDGPVS